MFRHEHGQPAAPKAPVDERLVSAATLVLDQRTEDISKTKADDLLASITAESTTSSTPTHVQQASSVPLPPPEPDKAESVEPVDDLEF